MKLIINWTVFLIGLPFVWLFSFGNAQVARDLFDNWKAEVFNQGLPKEHYDN